MNIKDLNPGEYVVRVKRGGFGGTDGSYLGVKFMLDYIVNGQIHLTASEPSKKLFEEVPKKVKLSECDWYDGWSYWVDPKKFQKSKNNYKKSKKSLELSLLSAIEEENYELADTLKKAINDSKI